MRAAPTLWWKLTPVQRALLKRVARDGPLIRLLAWEGRTVRSLVARNLLRREAQNWDGRGESGGWRLTPKAHQLLSQAMDTAREP